MKLFNTILELVLLLGLGGFSIFASLYETGKPWYDVYVSCNDERYRKPFIPIDKHLVQLKWLYIAVLLILPILIFVFDMLQNAGFPKLKLDRREGKLQKALSDSCNATALYYSGIFLLMLFCKMSQLIGGNPAPYFLTLCSPGCSNTTGSYQDPTTGNLYITKNTCPSSVLKEFRPDTLSSFPSVHATLSFYAAAFVICFYFSRGTTSYTRLLQPTITILVTSLAIVTSMSRFNEYSNHAIDVAGGAGLGAIMSAVQVFLIGETDQSGKKRE